MWRGEHLQAQAEKERVQGVRDGEYLREHKRQGHLCKECGGASICQHKQERRTGKACKAGQLRAAGAQRNTADEQGDREDGAAQQEAGVVRR